MSQSSNDVQDVIILVGNDERLVYLLNRYFEHSPCQLVPWDTMPSVAELVGLHPVMIIFSTIELLESSQSYLNYTSSSEIPVLVCTSLASEAHARELGADACLIHPLTYGNFKSAMTGICPMES